MTKSIINAPVFLAANKEIINNASSELIPMEEGMVHMGEPAPPFVKVRKKRTLYKECQIAGITFHDLSDVWDELYVGAELALIRQKDNEHDEYAIAVALADDYDGDADDFDFNLILGYVPRTENEELAKMMDMGWNEAFECELSQMKGGNPYKGTLHMKIYIVSKDEEETVVDTSNLLRVMEFDYEQHEEFIGLPTPALAIAIGSLAWALEEGSILLSPSVILAIGIVGAWLLISPLRMFSLKFRGLSLANATNRLRYLFIILALGVVIIGGLGMVWAAIVLYILLSMAVQAAQFKCKNNSKNE
jgi:hypothetical protein